MTVQSSHGELAPPDSPPLGAMATSAPPAPPEAPREGEALAEGDEAPQKRKATSFKITNVFLSRPPSNDGEDSCEDGEELEDSRTEVSRGSVTWPGVT